MVLQDHARHLVKIEALKKNTLIAHIFDQFDEVQRRLKSMLADVKKLGNLVFLAPAARREQTSHPVRYEQAE